jgi:hypothetical protein
VWRKPLLRSERFESAPASQVRIPKNLARNWPPVALFFVSGNKPQRLKTRRS